MGVIIYSCQDVRGMGHSDQIGTLLIPQVQTIPVYLYNRMSENCVGKFCMDFNFLSSLKNYAEYMLLFMLII